MEKLLYRGKSKDVYEIAEGKRTIVARNQLKAAELQDIYRV